jgi:hypothetical protein
MSASMVYNFLVDVTAGGVHDKYDLVLVYVVLQAIV